MNQSEEIQELTKLREDLLGGIVPLVDSGSLEPGERFDLYTRLAQSRGRFEYYQKAYHAAQEMIDSGDKLRSYLSLLGDVDYEIQTKSEQPESAPEPAYPPSSIPVVSTED